MAADSEVVWRVQGEGHLATNEAGAGARAQADALRRAQPVRTRLARLLNVHTDERAYRIGAKGEAAVGRRLDRLPSPAWMALHDIALNDAGTNIDHLVIGPAGVFSLNTKHHPKAKVVVTARTFKVNGYRQSYLPVAVSEARKVERILGGTVNRVVEVRPVIVVMGAELEIRAKPADVDIVRRRDLPKWFLELPQKLGAQEVRELIQLAGRPST